MLTDKRSLPALDFQRYASFAGLLIVVRLRPVRERSQPPLQIRDPIRQRYHEPLPVEIELRIFEHDTQILAQALTRRVESLPQQRAIIADGARLIFYLVSYGLCHDCYSP